MSIRVKKHSLLTKMIVVYTIPFMILSLLLVWNNHNSIESIRVSFITNMSNAFDQASRELDKRLDMAYDLTEMVSRNNKIITFIENPAVSNKSEFLYQYLDSVTPIIKYATAFTETDDYAIRIYMTNDEIPEAWPYFFSLNNYSTHNLIQRFVEQDNQTQLWLTPEDPMLGPETLNSERSKYTLLTKLYSPTRQLLGIVAVMVAEDSLLGTAEIETSSDFVQFLYHDGSITLATSELDELTEAETLSQHLNDDKTYFIDNQYLYLYRHFESIGQVFIYKVSLEQLESSTNKSVLNLVLLIVLSVALLIVTCYFMFKTIFLRLNRIVSIMRKVINGNSYLRIPDMRHDELGQLAQDFNGLIEMNNTLIERVVMKERLRKEAQIKALQYQINPHFIYNTLDIFRMKLIKERMFSTADGLADFGKILRYNLSDNTMHTTLKEEIELIRKYVRLQSLSSNQEIALQVEVEEGLEQFPVIKFLLQPIVENSIKYGKTVERKTLQLTIHCYVNRMMVYIDITDNAAGIPAWKARELNEQFQAALQVEEAPGEPHEEHPRTNSIGLQNINARLRLYYGSSYYLHIDSEEHEYTRVQIKLPYE